MFNRPAIAAILAALSIAGLAEAQTHRWPQVEASRLVALESDDVRLTPHGDSGCPSTGDWIAGTLAVDSAGAVCYATVSGSPGTWVQVGVSAASGVSIADSAGYFVASTVEAALAELVDGSVVATVNLDADGLIIANHGATGAPSSGTWATGQVVFDDAGAGYYCTVGGTPGTWVPFDAGLSSVANWSALPGSPTIGQQAFVESMAALVTFVDADPTDLWLPEPWASDVQGRITNGSAVELYISVSGGDDELTDLTSRGWVAEGAPTFDTDHFVFNATRVEAAPATWPAVALYAILSDCASASGSQALASFAPGVFDGTKTVFTSRSWAATAATGVADQTGIASATTPGTTFYGEARGGYSAPAGYVWTWLVVDAGGSVTLIAQDSTHRSAVPYSALGTVLATTDEIWIGTALSNNPVIHVKEFHALDLDAP